MTNVQKIKTIVGANMREKLWAAAASASYTKAEIKEAFEISDASFSSQASYLRWTGKHIVVEADGIVRQGSNEDFEKYQQARLERKTAVPKPKDLEKQKAQSIKRITALATALGYEVEAALSVSLTETDILEAKLTVEKARLAAITKELASLSGENNGTGNAESDENDGTDENDGFDESDGIENEENSDEVPGTGDDDLI